ncbi:MAG: sigma-54-dependent Fis family transcriptional regulator [Acidobacteriota bacterium]
MAKAPQNSPDGGREGPRSPGGASPSAEEGRADAKRDSGSVDELLRLAGKALEHGDVDELLGAALDAMVRWCEAQRGIVLLFGEDGQVLASRGRGIDQRELEAKELEVSRSVVLRVQQSGRLYWHENVLEDPELGRAASLYHLQLLSVICSPIHFQGNLLGVVYLDSHRLEALFSSNLARDVERFCGLLSGAAAQALERRRLEGQITDLRQRLGQQGQTIVTEDPQMLDLLRLVDRVAASSVPVLIRGESGTGKELVAKAVHDASPYSSGPFLALNCGALTESLLESQLFGHVRGAFTGAVRDEPGWFQRAAGGTLFLDEVGELPPALQVKLLRVLESGELSPVGSSKVLRSDARVVAATHQDLEAKVEDGSLRQDFFYRLNVFELRIPPLKQRRGDIPLLARHFLDGFAADEGRPALALTSEVLQILEAHDYPGNVRELAHALRRAALLSEGETLDATGLPPNLQPPSLQSSPSSPTTTASEDSTVGTLNPPKELLDLDFKQAKARWTESFERAYLEQALRATRGNISAAARRAGLDYKNFYNKMRTLGLDPQRYR